MAKSYYPIELIQQCCSEYRTGTAVSELCRKYQIPRSTMYYWAKKYAGLPNATDIPTKKSLDNMRRAYEKTRQMYEVLKRVDCTASAPLQIKLYELEKIYGQYPVRVLCEALDVDRGTFYNHVLRNKKRNNSYTARRLELSEVIRDIFEGSRGLFGSDKILSALQSKGYKTSKKMVLQLMREMGLKSLRSTAKKDHKTWCNLHTTKNILQQEFNVEEPNLAWVSDCTQCRLFDKTYYICAILDLYSRKVLAYKISMRASTQLVTATFKAAIQIRQPGNGLIFHSDRGCQYTSLAFRKLLLEHEIVQSFSRAGTPYDNGAMESFFSSLKQEEIYRTSYTSEKDFKRKIAEYMNFYNERRPHRANNYKTPDQKELAFWEKNKNRCPNKTGSDVVTDYVQTPI